MTKMNLLPQKKINSDKNLPLTDVEIYSMKKKLENKEYMDGAMYKLASILTDRILNGGFTNEEKKLQTE